MNKINLELTDFEYSTLIDALNHVCYEANILSRGEEDDFFKRGKAADDILEKIKGSINDN